MKRLATLAAALLVGSIGMSVALAERSTANPTPPPAPIQIIDGNLAPANYWYAQTGNACGPTALNFVIGAVKGTRVKAATIEAYGERIGAYTPSGGMSWPGGVDILAHYGIKATAGAHSLPYLEEALRTGHRVVALVNANAFWPQFGWIGPSYPAADWHAVVVDQVNLTSKTVYLTDPGPSTGQIEVISIDTFKSAWAPGGYLTIVTK